MIINMTTVMVMMTVKKYIRIIVMVSLKLTIKNNDISKNIENYRSNRNKKDIFLMVMIIETITRISIIIIIIIITITMITSRKRTVIIM